MHTVSRRVGEQGALDAYEAYRQWLSGRLGTVSVSAGLQAGLGLREEPASMTQVLGFWLDDYEDVDAFYRGQETVVKATAAGYAQAGIPLHEVFERFGEVPPISPAMHPASPGQ